MEAIAPTYPGIARSAGAEGEVVVEVKIDAEGKVTSAITISGRELLYPFENESGCFVPKRDMDAMHNALPQ